MDELDLVNVSVSPGPELPPAFRDCGTDYVQMVCDLDSQLDLLESDADAYDYLVAVGSGLVCAAVDVLFTGEFDLAAGRVIAAEKVDGFVVKAAKATGFKGDDVAKAVAHLERAFPVPSDAAANEFGGGLQHHLRDFSHHPSLAGLGFSLLTQFTGQAYGTDTAGKFLVVPLSSAAQGLIGATVPQKLFNGTVVWFMHLVSDMAGSKATAGLSGGTGIPGPILSIAKELSAIPFFQEVRIDERTLSELLSKLYNGTLLAQHDASGNIIRGTEIRFDLRGELGLGIELTRQAFPVLLNDCIVRSFYFIRRLAVQVRRERPHDMSEFFALDWKRIIPVDNPTISAMMLVASGTFTGVDLGHAAATKSWVAINVVGIGRFAVAVGSQANWYLKARDIKRIRRDYVNILDQVRSRQIGSTVPDLECFAIDTSQTEILYNLEALVVENDIAKTRRIIGQDDAVRLKREWLDTWKDVMARNFSGFMQEDVRLTWYTEPELYARIRALEPKNTWYKLVLFEALLFEPYYALGAARNDKGEFVPDRKYDPLRAPLSGLDNTERTEFLEKRFVQLGGDTDLLQRLAKTHGSMKSRVGLDMKGVAVGVGGTLAAAAVAALSAGAFAGPIAVALVGSNFGLSGAALVSASLAYLGGGAIAAGGAGMAGGAMAIVGGGTALALSSGAVVNGTLTGISVVGKDAVIKESAKLLTSTKVILLESNKDFDEVKSVADEYYAKCAEDAACFAKLDIESERLDKEQRDKASKAIDGYKKMRAVTRETRKALLDLVAEADAEQVRALHIV